jgi:palmitoyltransferase
MMPARRRHGLQRPLAQQQILAWIAVLLCIAEFWSLVFPFLPSALLLPVALVYCTVFALGFVAYLRVSLQDPQIDRSRIGADQHISRHCYTCPGVMPDHTKHCRVCNKCIERFDHHCVRRSCRCRLCIGS